MLIWTDNTEDLKLRDVEKRVLETRREMGAQLEETIVREEATTIEAGADAVSGTRPSYRRGVIGRSAKTPADRRRPAP